MNLLAPEEHTDTLLAIADPCQGEVADALLEGRMLIALRLAVPCVNTEPAHHAGTTLTDLIGRKQVVHRLASLRCAHHFRELISWSMALSGFRSATSFFSAAFSSRSCLNSRT